MTDLPVAPPVTTTIFDIAAAAGVSIATADRAVNGRKGVSAATAARVLEAAARLNWQPNLVARSLSKKEMLTVSVLLPETANPFMRELIAGVSAAREVFRPFRVLPGATLVRDLDPAALAAALLRLKHRPEGVALVGLQHPLVIDAIDTLVASGTPVVTLVSDVIGSRHQGYVGIDNYAAGRTAAVLLGRFVGAKPGAVALFAGTKLYSDIIQRECGFLEAMGARFAGLDVLPSIWHGEDNAHSYALAADLLANRKDLRGVYVAGGGQFGVAHALRDSGRQDEVVLIAHDVVGDMAALLRGGTVAAVINQNPQAQVHSALQLLTRLNSRLLPPGQVEHTPIEIYVAENLPRNAS